MSFTVSKQWHFGKCYTTIKQDDVDKHYLAPGDELVLDVDIAGRVHPTNAIQEYHQTIGKKLAKRMRKFRKDFIQYCDTYWELFAAPPKTNNSWPKDHFVDITLVNPDGDMAELLKYIKKHSHERDKVVSGQWTWQPMDKKRALKLWLERFTRTWYRKMADQHEMTPVPLGTPCPKPKYEKI